MRICASERKRCSLWLRPGEDMPVKKAPEIRCFQSPSRYLQGPNTFETLHETVAIFGTRAFAVIDYFFFDELSKKLESQFAEHGLEVTCTKFENEINQDNLDRINEKVSSLGYIPDFIIGIGGGKSCDMAKAVATDFNTRVIVMPTALSTDAPTSCHSVLYHDDGSHYLKQHRRNPDYVIVDTELAIKAPVITFISGLGDAMATYFEGVACYTNNDLTYAGGSKYCTTQAGRAIARLAYEVLMKYGRQAYEDAKAHRRTQAFEDVAEANTLLSGLGFENTRCAIAHGLQGIFNQLPAKPLLHGQQVGYALLVQLLVEIKGGVEGRKKDFAEIFEWSRDVGLPLCFADLGITEDADIYMRKMAHVGVEESYLVKNEPFEVTEEMVYSAICELEEYARDHAGK